MLAPLVLLAFAAQPQVVIGTGSRASTLQVSRLGKPTLGDTLDLVALSDVISPRILQRRAGEATRFTLDLVLGEQVTVEPRKPDELTQRLGEEEDVTVYGRVRVGKVWVHEALLEAGWAWVLPAARGDAKLVKLEAAAREAKRGLWADPEPLEPWLWRELLLLSDDEGKVLHAGWDCPHVKQTQCKRCRQQRFYSLERAAAAGFTPHEACMPKDVLRVAAASGERPTERDGEEEGRAPRLPPSPRRACERDADCALTPLTPCACSPCGVWWREPARKDVAARMKQNFSRVACAGVGCPSCAGIEHGTRAVCVEKQCAVTGPPAP